MTTNSKEGNNIFCPGEPIILNCLVMSTALFWFITKSSLVIQGQNTKYITFNVYAPSGDPYLFLDSSAGRLNFYRNESYTGSFRDSSQSFINSELHMQLNHANDFIVVTCVNLVENTFTMIKITTVPGMLNIARKKYLLL